MGTIVTWLNMDFINWFFILSIIIYFGYSYNKVTKHIVKPTDILKKLCNLTAFMEPTPEESRRLFLKHYQEITQAFRSCGNKAVEHQWREFEEQMIFPDGENIVHIMNTIPPSAFFDEEAIIGEQYTLRHLDAVVAKLTGIGILGTFLGLTIGINSISGGIDDSANILKGIQKLLEGAGTAFVTSLFGLLFAMIFSALEKYKYGKFTEKLSELISSLERCLVFYTVEKNNLRVLEENIKQTRALNDLGNQIAEAFDNAISQKLSLPMKDFSKSIESQLEAIRIANEESSRKISSSVTELVTSGTGGENLNRARESAHSALEAIANTMQTSLTDLVEKQSQMSFIIESALKKMDDQMNSGARNYQNTINQSLNELTESIKELIQNMKDQLTGSITQLSDGIANSQKDAFSTFQNSAQKVQDLVNFISQRNVDYTNEITNKTNQSFEEINKGLTNTVQSIREEFVSTLKNVGSESISAHKELVDNLNSNIDKFGNSLSELNNSSNIMNKAVGEFSRSIPELKGPASELKNSLDNLKFTSEYLNKTILDIKKSSESMNLGVEITESQVKNVNNAVDLIKKSNEKLELVWGNYDRRFSDVDSSLERTVLGLSQGVSNLTDVTGKHYSTIVGQVNQITGLFKGMIDDLSDLKDDNKKK